MIKSLSEQLEERESGCFFQWSKHYPQPEHDWLHQQVHVSLDAGMGGGAHTRMTRVRRCQPPITDHSQGIKETFKMDRKKRNLLTDTTTATESKKLQDLIHVFIWHERKDSKYKTEEWPKKKFHIRLKSSIILICYRRKDFFFLNDISQ